MRWENVTGAFTEEQRHYKNTYLEISEVYDDNVEVSLFSATNAPYEIYVAYGIMSGIVYAEEQEARLIREEIKKELENEYQKHKEPTDEFINVFAEKYNLCLPDNLYFDASTFLGMF